MKRGDVYSVPSGAVYVIYYPNDELVEFPTFSGVGKKPPFGAKPPVPKTN